MRAAEAWCRTILGTVGLLGFFAVALATLYRWDLRLDLTGDQRHSLSQHARAVLADVKTDVELIGFLRGQNPRNPYITDLLRRMANVASPRIRWHLVDVNRSPAKARRYGVSSYGAIVVKSGVRERMVTNPREETLILAILRVTRRGQPKTVYFVTGHGEKSPAERDRIRGYSQAAARVEEEFYQVRGLTLPSVREVPADATVLVIGGPRGRLTLREVNLLRAFVGGGGGVLVMLDAFQDGGLGPLLGEYGVALADEAVVDPKNRMFGGEFITMRIPVGEATHPIASGLGLAPLFSLPRPVEIGSVPSGGSADRVLRSGPASWATPDRDVLARVIPSFEPGRDRQGPITVGVEVRAPAREGRQAGRIVVYGSSEFASNFFLDRDGNADLLLNTIDWIAGEPELIAPRLPRKRQGTEQLLVLGDQGARIFWLAVVIEPGVFLLLGVMQFVRRRYGGS